VDDNKPFRNCRTTQPHYENGTQPNAKFIFDLSHLVTHLPRFRSRISSPSLPLNCIPSLGCYALSRMSHFFYFKSPNQSKWDRDYPELT